MFSYNFFVTYVNVCNSFLTRSKTTLLGDFIISVMDGSLDCGESELEFGESEINRKFLSDFFIPLLGRYSIRLEVALR